jgi:tetratricopeptide (TPR) repeat protein
MKSIHIPLIGLMLGLVSAPPAEASGMVIGQNLGAACYDEATWGNSDIDALDVCNRAIDEALLSTRDLAATYVNRGIVRVNRGDIDGGLKDYREALRLRPKLGDAMANMGTAYLRAEQYQEALRNLDKALQYDNLRHPSHVYFNIALAQEELGNTKEAYLNFKKAAELSPEWPWPRDELKRFTVSAQ